MRHLIGAMLLLFLSVPLNASTIYFAQVADGGGYTTAFTIYNPTTSAVSGTLKLRDDNGNPWTVSMTNGSTNSQFPVSIPAMGSVRLTTSGAGLSIKAGWAVLDSTENLNGVARYDFRSGSMLLDSVGVLGTPSGQRFVMPVDTSSIADTGIAIANVGTSGVNVRLELISQNGTVFESSLDPQFNPLGPQQHLARFASQLFPDLQYSSFRGLLSIEVIGTGSLAVVGLFYGENQLSAIPAVALAGSTSNLTSRQKAELLLGQWSFNYTIISIYLRRYNLMYAQADPDMPGVWDAFGQDEYGDPVWAWWDDDIGAYAMFDPTIGFYRFYIFDFTGADSVSGCYYQVFDTSGQVTSSDCIPMMGNRTSSSPPSSLLGRAPRQSQIETDSRDLSEAQSLGLITAKPNPAILKAFERLKRLK
jgi:hypothetical protein